MQSGCDVQVVIDGIPIDSGQIFTLKTHNKLLNDKFTVGTTANGVINLTLNNPHQQYSRMAAILVKVRDANTDWEPRGVYYIDTRETIVSGGRSKLSITGFDGMLLTSRVIDFGAIETWPATTIDVVQCIAQQSGILVESDTVSLLDDGTVMPKPEYLTGREVLECIGAMHCGSFMMNNSGELKFVDTVDLLRSKARSNLPDITRSALSATICNKPTTYSRVEVVKDENTVFVSGDTSGATIQVDIPWATQELADNICSKISGVTYQPYTASGVAVGILASLGDRVKVAESNHAIFELDVNYESPTYAAIAAPGADEVEHEFDYVPKIERQIKRAIGGVSRAVNEISEFDEHGNRVVAKKSLTAVFNSAGHFKSSELNLSIIEYRNTDGTYVYRSLADLLADVITLQGDVKVIGNFTVDKNGIVYIQAPQTHFSNSDVYFVNGSRLIIGGETITIYGYEYKDETITSTSETKHVIGWK